MTNRIDAALAKAEALPWGAGLDGPMDSLAMDETHGYLAAIRALKSKNLRCAECDFSRRWARNDTPEHDCPEEARHRVLDPFVDAVEAMA